MSAADFRRNNMIFDHIRMIYSSEYRPAGMQVTRHIFAAEYKCVYYIKIYTQC